LQSISSRQTKRHFFTAIKAAFDEYSAAHADGVH
jgi:hypothetical protein